MKRRIPIPIVIVTVIVVVGLLYLVGMMRPVADAIQLVVRPIARIFGIVGSEASQRLAEEPDVDTLQSEIRDAEARLVSVSVDYVKLKALEEENRALKELSSFLSTSGYDHVGARIISRSTDPQIASVLIDRGASDGLETGMAVVVGEGVFVGKIVSLSQHVSTVLLVSDRRSRVASSRAGAHKLFGIIEGKGNGVATLTLVPQAESLSRNDIIVTAGTEEKIPPNLAIGLVNDVEGQPTDPFKTASIEPLARPDTLSLVIVLRPGALRPNGAN